MDFYERRHPCEVTADRLADHYERWFAVFSQSELDAIGIVREALLQIAENQRLLR
jgi:hypothetical protein